MTKPVLDVPQMQHLQELGLELDYDTLYRYVKFEDTDWMLKPFSDLNIIGISCKYIPAYTLQDVLDALPDFIDEYCLIIDMSFGVIRYDNLKRKDSPILKETYFDNEDKYLIDAAYEMLCWCVENGHLKMKGNENKSI